MFQKLKENIQQILISPKPTQSQFQELYEACDGKGREEGTREDSQIWPAHHFGCASQLDLDLDFNYESKSKTKDLV